MAFALIFVATLTTCTCSSTARSIEASISIASNTASSKVTGRLLVVRCTPRHGRSNGESRIIIDRWQCTSKVVPWF
jgi:hypothetical protein